MAAPATSAAAATAARAMGGSISRPEHSMAIATAKPLLGEIVLDEGVVTASAVDAALVRMATTGERIGEALITMGAATAEDVSRAVARQNTLPFLGRDELPSPLPILKNVSPMYLRQYVVCPISVDADQLTVSAADPLNLVMLDDLRQCTGLDIKLAVSPPEAILEAIERTYSGNASALQRIVEGMEDERTTDGEEDVNHLRDMA